MSEAPRKPWYLVVALLTCLLGFGGCGATAAWGGVERYRGVQLEAPTQDLSHEDDRKRASAAYDRWTAALETERSRAFPLGVAELVLGFALFVFASAAWMGRNGARRALVQITLAQALLVVATFVVTPRSRAAELDWRLDVQTSKMVEAGQPRDQADKNLPVLRVFAHGSAIAALVLRSLVAALVLVALTRPNVLAYYAATNDRPNES